jgi:hypothetical protein
VSALTGGIVGGAQAGLGLVAQDALDQQEFEREQTLMLEELKRGGQVSKRYDDRASKNSLR